MKNKITTTQKATRIGGGLWVYLPSSVKKSFGIEEGDDIEFEVRANKSKENNKTYQCLDCLYLFATEDQDCPECPNCDGHRLQLVDEIQNTERRFDNGVRN